MSVTTTVKDSIASANEVTQTDIGAMPVAADIYVHIPDFRS